jgi:hypothetical protein
MTDLMQTISNNMSRFESLTAKIPGYKGYKEKEMRRQADSILRQHLAAKLGEQLRRAEEMGKQMLIGPGLAQLNNLGAANTRLQTLVDKVKTAAQGYAGFFDAIKVKEDELDQLYQFDDQMLFKVNDITTALDNLQTALDSGDAAAMASAVRGYTTAVTETSALFDQRKDVLTGLA